MFFSIFKLKTGIRHTSCITARSRLFSTDLAEKQSHRIFNDRTFLAASNYFSSAVILAFDDMKQERMTNGDISKVQKSAQSTLDLLKRGSYGSKGVDIERTRRAVGDAVVKIIPNIRTDNELILLASCMAIIMPRSDKVWLNIDKDISTKSDIFSVDSLSLFTTVLLSASDKFRISFDRLITPKIIAMRILDSTDEILSIDEGPHFTSQEKFGLSTTRIESLPGNTTGKIIPFAENEDKISELPTRGIHMNLRSIIHLGLYLQVLSKFQNDVNFIPTTNKRNLQMISDRCKSLLTSKSTYYPIKALEPLWRVIPSFKLPDCSEILRYLYRQISHTLWVDPMQIQNQENLIKSLLRSMIVSNLPDRKLITEIFEIYDKCGYDQKKYGRYSKIDANVN